MKNQTLILLIIAGACGLVAMLGAKQYLDSKSVKEEVPKVKVLVTQMPVKAGERLTDANTQFITVEKATCPEGVVTELEQIAERSSKVPRGAGDWLFLEQLNAPGAYGAVGNIPTGMRVATIAVDATTNHSGMLQPGIRIDLMLTFKDRIPETGEQTTRVIPLLEYIEVFAVDNQQYGRDVAGENVQARNISLLVDTEQMMKLQLAKKKGDISTVLRSSEDKEMIEFAGLEEDSLTGGRRSELNDQSALDNRLEAGFAVPEFNLGGMFAELEAAAQDNGPTASAPVMASKDRTENTWIMAIHESGSVRVEHVDLTSDVPKDTTAAGRNTLPAAPGTMPGAVMPLTPATLPGLEDLGLGADLEETISALPDLLN